MIARLLKAARRKMIPAWAIESAKIRKHPEVLTLRREVAELKAENIALALRLRQAEKAHRLLVERSKLIRKPGPEVTKSKATKGVGNVSGP